MAKKYCKFQQAVYFNLFAQGLTYKQVAKKLDVNATSAFRQYKKWQELRISVADVELAKAQATEEEIEQAVKDYELNRIAVLLNLHKKLNEALGNDNTQAVKDYANSISKLNEPLSTLANLKGLGKN